MEESYLEKLENQLEVAKSKEEVSRYLFQNLIKYLENQSSEQFFVMEN